MVLRKTANGGVVKFSVVIPTRNRADILKDTLHFFREMDYPVEDYEIVVADNGSSDLTRLVVEAANREAGNIVYCREETVGSSFARNAGAAIAKHPRLIFIDDDIVMRKSFLRAHRRAWEKYPDAAALGGKIHARLEDAAFTRRHRKILETHSFCFAHFDLGPSDRELGFGELLYGPNIGYKRQADSGPVFDTRLGLKIFPFANETLRCDDFELCSRLILQGKKVMYVADPDMEIIHRVYESQFSDEHLVKRHYFAGIENYVMDRILDSKFPGYLRAGEGTLLRKLWSKRRLGVAGMTRRFLSKHWLIMMASYYFNGKNFFPAPRPQAAQPQT